MREMSYGYLPHTESDVREMLRVIGLDSLEALFAHVPKEVRLHDGPLAPSNWPALSQGEVERVMVGLAEKNIHGGRMPAFLGAGLKIPVSTPL